MSFLRFRGMGLQAQFSSWDRCQRILSFMVAFLSMGCSLCHLTFILIQPASTVIGTLYRGQYDPHYAFGLVRSFLWLVPCDRDG